MKQLNYILLVFSGILVASCDNVMLSEGIPDFDVSVSAKTYKVGEQVVFDFSGNADLITFYSGEVLCDYDYRKGRIVEAGEMEMSFSTYVQYGNQTKMQLSVWASSQFNGDYNSFDNINMDEWTNITDRCVIATNQNKVSSGIVNLSDLIEGDKPLYIGFRYICYGGTLTGRTWRVQNFQVTSETETLGKQTLADMTTVGFKSVDQGAGTEYEGNTQISSTTLLMAGPNPPHPTDDYERMVITKPLYGGKVDMGPDRPVAIKAMADPRLTEYKYAYNKAGKYKAYFLAYNATIDSSCQVMKELELEIVE